MNVAIALATWGDRFSRPFLYEALYKEVKKHGKTERFAANACKRESDVKH